MVGGGLKLAAFAICYSTVNATDTSSSPQWMSIRCLPFSKGRLPENGRFSINGVCSS